MPWIADSGREYRLALLDTNALSEIVKNPAWEGAGFFNLLGTGQVAPCFTAYNLAELYAADGVFETFVAMFDEVPCFLTKPQDAILFEELEHYETGEPVIPLLNAFVPAAFRKDDSYDVRTVVREVFGDAGNRTAMDQWDDRANEVMGTWLENKRNFEPSSDHANSKDADRYLETAGQQTLMNINPAWVRRRLDRGELPDLTRFPSLMVMAYSQYWRFWDPSWSSAPGEVTDIRFITAAPYMDIVVTEKRQAEIFRKIRDKVPGLSNLKVLRLSDLRKLAEA